MTMRETWVLYQRPIHEVTHWPYEMPWERLFEWQQPWLEAAEPFARFSLCDGQSETPTVPARLPRMATKGRYRAAIHHDADWLYVLFEATSPPPVHGLTHRYESQACVTLASDDLQWLTLATIDGTGTSAVSVRANDLGPRQATTPLPQPGCEMLSWHVGDAQRYAWRWRRAELDGWQGGGRWRMSVSRWCAASMEAVAWGTHHVWSPRVDELIEVQPADRAPRLPWPTVQRVELDYRPVEEAGQLRVQWHSAYEMGETFAIRAGRSASPPVDRWQLWCNDRPQLMSFDAAAPSAAMPVADGVNQVRLASSSSPVLELVFAKMTGNRLLEPVAAAAPVRDRAWLKQWMDNEAHRVLERRQQRIASGEKLSFRAWGSYHGSSVGRAVHHLGLDERLLDVLRDEAELALTLQNPDGTYSGYHLKHRGRKPGPWAGGAYDAGPTGELWVVAYRLLGDDRYLAASQRLVDAYASYRVEFNHNYAAFALYHLAEHYRLTQCETALAHGCYYAEQIAGADLLPLGYQAGHNYYSVYGGITLRGLALLAQVMPADHALRPWLREKCLRMANQLFRRLGDDGLFDARDRNHLGLKLSLPMSLSVAPLLDVEDAHRLDRVMQCMLNVPMSYWLELSRDPRPMYRRLDSELIRYWAIRDRLLAGDPIDTANHL